MSMAGSTYYVFVKKFSVDDTKNEERLIKSTRFKENKDLYFVLGFLPALANPEVLQIMPWPNKREADSLGGLPSTRCALFCTVASVLENIPQLLLQWLFDRRNRLMEGVGETPWSIKLSIGFSVTSLVLRVFVRLCVVAMSLF